MSVRRRLSVVAGAAVLAATLTGCAVAPESRLDDYEKRAEEIHAEVLAQLPAGAEHTVSSRAWFDESEWLVPAERHVAHWTTESTITLDAPLPPTAAAIGEHLVAARWTAESIVEADGFHSDVYRLGEADGEWIVEVSWGDGRRLVVIVQSPVTVRGAARG